MLILALFGITTALNQNLQTSINSEDFSEPVCEVVSRCAKCTFKEMREVEVCSSSGHYQTVVCTMKDRKTDISQEFSYSEGCSGDSELLTSFDWFLGLNLGLMGGSLFYWAKKKNFKIHRQQDHLRNIIKA